MKKACLCLAFLATAVIASAQQKFLPGYIISTDTIVGEIRSFSPDRTPQKIEFRKNNVVTDYVAGAIKGFGFTGEENNYISATVTYQLNPADYRGAREEFSTETKTTVTFLKQLVNGIVSLYHLMLPQRDHFFSGMNGQFKELIYRVKIVNQQIVIDEQYKNQITFYASE